MADPDEVRLWVFPLALKIGDTDLLSPDETARAARLHFPHHRDRFIAGRAIMRRILGNALNQNPASLRFQYGASGKPSLPGGLHFNLSHTGDLGALALAEFELGIDIEQVRPIEPGVAKRFFAADEIAALDALPPARRLDAFYTGWVRKEAYLKASGDGLTRPLDSFSVSLDLPARLLRCADDDAAQWTLHPFTPAQKIAGAIAARRTRLRVTAAASVPDAPR